MDGYGQSIMRHNFYSFNLLQPCYHQEQPSRDEFSFDDGFGFDPSPTEQIMLDQFPGTADLLSATTCQIPCQSLPTCLLPQNSELARAPIGQNSNSHILSRVSDAGRASAVLQHGEKFEEKSTAPDLMPKRTQDKAHTTRSLESPKARKDLARMRSRKSLQSSNPTQSPCGYLEVDKRKELSLEKNRVAAAKCRIKKKTMNEQMLQDSQTKSKENRKLHNIVRAMEMEMDALTTFLSAHSNSSSCKKSEQLRDAFHMFQEAAMSKQLPDLSNGSSSVDSPAPSFSGKSTNSLLLSLSPATLSLSPKQSPTMDSYLLGDMDIDSPPYAEGSEEQVDLQAYFQYSPRAAGGDAPDRMKFAWH